jgi:hypothetical protein
MPRRPRAPKPLPARRRLPPRAPVIKRISRRPQKPRLHIYEILGWADEHHQRTGRWPTSYSGTVHAAPWDSWRAVDTALRHGGRGCRGKSSLPLLLHRNRGRPLPLPLPRPKLTVRQVLAWADAYHRRTGRWPSQFTRGPVAEGRLESWSALNNALHKGDRGFPGGDSIAKILLRYRGVRRARNRPHFTIKQILAWADRYHAVHGRWPKPRSGAVAGSGGDTWMAIQKALVTPCRGLRAGYTLVTLLEKHRGVRNRQHLAPFTPRRMLAWADTFHRRHDRWPMLKSGPIPEAPGETWLRVEGALNKGQRGLPGGDSLSQFLMRHNRRPYHDWRKRVVRHERLSLEQIVAWADTFFQKNQRWPAAHSGPIAGTRNETWLSVDVALRAGVRGLPGGSSVALLLEERRGARHKHHRAPFLVKDLLAWADAYLARHGRWPSAASGPIPESAGDSWSAVDNALRAGTRGLPGRDSLRRCLDRHGRA